MQALVLGATGLVGNAILKSAEKDPLLVKVYTLTRRALSSEHPASVEAIVDKEPSTWDKKLPHADIVFSSLATTRGAAGGTEAQYKIDHDLNIDLAKVAKAQGATTYVLISSAGADSGSLMFYMRMKGEIERDILALGFERTIILRPGPLLGQRDGIFKGFGEGAMQAVAKHFHRSWAQSILSYPVYGDEVGKVAVHLATTAPKGVHYVSSSEILKLASTIS